MYGEESLERIKEEGSSDSSLRFAPFDLGNTNSLPFWDEWLGSTLGSLLACGL